MSAEPLLNGPEFALAASLLVLVIVAAAAFREWQLNRRTLEELQRDVESYRPGPRDLRVDRAPEVDRDERHTRARHARVCNLKETTR